MTNGEEVFPIRGDALRNWLRTAGSHIFTFFDTGYQALDFIRGQGAAIRTEDFYRIRGQVLARVGFDARLGEYDTGQLVPKAWHEDDHGWNLSTNYLYRLAVHGYDPKTEDEIDTYLSVGSDRQLTMQEVYDQIGEMSIEEQIDTNVIIESFYIERAMMRPGMVW